MIKLFFRFLRETQVKILRDFFSCVVFLRFFFALPIDRLCCFELSEIFIIKNRKCFCKYNMLERYNDLYILCFPFLWLGKIRACLMEFRYGLDGLSILDPGDWICVCGMGKMSGLIAIFFHRFC